MLDEKSDWRASWLSMSPECKAGNHAWRHQRFIKGDPYASFAERLEPPMPVEECRFEVLSIRPGKPLWYRQYIGVTDLRLRDEDAPRPNTPLADNISRSLGLQTRQHGDEIDILSPEGHLLFTVDTKNGQVERIVYALAEGLLQQFVQLQLDYPHSGAVKCGCPDCVARYGPNTTTAGSIAGKNE